MSKTISELKKELEELNLSTTGNKEELTERLDSYFDLLPKDVKKIVKNIEEENASPDTKVFKYLLELALNEGVFRKGERGESQRGIKYLKFMKKYDQYAKIIEIKESKYKVYFSYIGNLPDNIFVDLVSDYGIGPRLELMRMGLIPSIENMNEVFELFGSDIRIMINQQAREFELVRVKRMGKAPLY